MAIAWAKQAECWKNFLWLRFLPDTATQRQVIDFFITTILLRFYMC